MWFASAQRTWIWYLRYNINEANKRMQSKADKSRKSTISCQALVFLIISASHLFIIFRFDHFSYVFWHETHFHAHASALFVSPIPIPISLFLSVSLLFYFSFLFAAMTYGCYGCARVTIALLCIFVYALASNSSSSLCVSLFIISSLLIKEKRGGERVSKIWRNRDRDRERNLKTNYR